MRYNYNRQLTPPAPFVHVRAAAPASGKAVEPIPVSMFTTTRRGRIAAKGKKHPSVA